MIFKTFNSDIDKISSKWGMFGRSFNDIGTAISAKISTINKNFQATDDLIGSIKNSGDSIWKRLYPSKENIKSQLIDVDTLIPEIDESKASKILETIKSIESGTNEEIKTFQDLYDTGDKTNQWIAEYAQSTRGQIRSTEGVIKANQQAREAAIACNSALKQQTLGSKAATVATKALAVAGNMLLFMAISKGISLAVTAIDDYIHRIDNLKEAAEEAKSAIDDIKSEFDSLKSTTDDVKERFAELAQGGRKSRQRKSVSWYFIHR